MSESQDDMDKLMSDLEAFSKTKPSPELPKPVAAPQFKSADQPHVTPYGIDFSAIPPQTRVLLTTITQVGLSMMLATPELIDALKTVTKLYETALEEHKRDDK